MKEISNGTLKEDEAFEAVLDFLRSVIELPCCPSLAGGASQAKATACTCLHELRPAEGDGDGDTEILRMVASHVCYFGSLSNNERRLLEIEYCDTADFLQHLQMDTDLAQRRPFHLKVRSTVPYEAGMDPDALAAFKSRQAKVRGPFVCPNAFMLCYGLGRVRFGGSRQHAALNTFPVHGLKGKKGKASNRKSLDVQGAEENLADFFSELLKEAEVPATRMVRTLAGMELREEEEDRVDLPHHYTKRSLYKRWAFESGHKVVTDAKGRNTTTDREDDYWPADKKPLPIVSWKSFLNYWDEHHKNLRIRSKCEDTCGECQIVAQRFKYKSFNQFVREHSIAPNTHAADLFDSIRKSGIDFVSTAEDCSGRDNGDYDNDDKADAADIKMLEAALLHVKAAKKQRELHDSIQVRSRQSMVDIQIRIGRSFSYRLIRELGNFNRFLRLSFTADYCQNLGLPFLGTFVSSV